jgi:predicted AlkP superfamily phosphohydrolase/phosphomutase
VHYPNASHIHAETLWGILSQEGKRVGVFHVPMTYPPEKVNGFLVSGMGVPEDKGACITFPSDLKERMEKALGFPYRPYPEYAKGRDPYESFLEDAFRLLKERRAVIRWLRQEYDPDFLMMVISETDFIAHYFWKHMDDRHPLFTTDGQKKFGNAILRLYAEADKFLGELMEEFGPENDCFVVSDHGMGPFYVAPDYIQYYSWKEWMALHIRMPRTQRALWLLSLLFGVWVGSRKTLQWAKLHLPWSARNLFNRWFPRGKKFVSSSFSLLNFIDWEKTKIFFPDPRNAGLLYINLKGRRPKGVVEASEYEALRTAMIEDLKSLKVPGTDIPIVEGVYRREEVYSGPFLEEAPDVLIVWNTEATGTLKNLDLKDTPEALKKLFVPLHIIPFRNVNPIPFSGWQRMEGIFFARGEGIKKGYRMSGAGIMDVLPTVLAKMGVAIPEDVDGKVLTDIFEPEYQARFKPRYRPPARHETLAPYTPEEEAGLRKRLQELGYLDCSSA